MLLVATTLLAFASTLACFWYAETFMGAGIFMTVQNFTRDAHVLSMSLQ